MGETTYELLLLTYSQILQVVFFSSSILGSISVCLHRVRLKSAIPDRTQSKLRCMFLCTWTFGTSTPLMLTLQKNSFLQAPINIHPALITQCITFQQNEPNWKQNSLPLSYYGSENIWVQGRAALNWWFELMGKLRSLFQAWGLVPIWG